jgi:hypothetical protein
VNDRNEKWGRTIAIKLRELPQMFDTTLELVIQIREEGFLSFINGAFFLNYF